MLESPRVAPPPRQSVTYLGRGVEILVQGTWSLSLVTYSFHPSPAGITHTSVEVPFRCLYEVPTNPRVSIDFFPCCAFRRRATTDDDERFTTPFAISTTSSFFNLPLGHIRPFLSPCSFAGCRRRHDTAQFMSSRPQLLSISEPAAAVGPFSPWT